MEADPSSRLQTGASSSDAQFVGSIPDVYEGLLVPMFFDDPAARLAETVSVLAPQDVLETAAGTGALTRALSARMPTASITATDLNEAMLVQAQRSSTDLRGVTRQQADAQALPFADASFDLVVCQFGIMFLPDKHAGFREARRVLRPGGYFVFNVWDSLETNEFPATVHRVVTAAAPESPPGFLARTPYGYFDRARVFADLERAGFRVDLQVCDGVNRAEVQDVAAAICLGTPLRLELDACPGLGAERATASVAQSLADEFGDGVITGRARWLQVVATSPLDHPGATSSSSTS